MRFFNRLKIQRVIIYGLHSEDWNIALGPNSKVWHLLPNVGRVLVVEGLPEFLPKRRLYFKDCIIPLMENHIKATPDSTTTLLVCIMLLKKSSSVISKEAMNGFSLLARREYMRKAFSAYSRVFMNSIL